MRRSSFVVSLLCSLCLVLVPAAHAAPGVPSGYWLVAGDGGVFSFRAPYVGSAASMPSACPPNTVDRNHPNGQCFAIASKPNGSGYWILNGDHLHVFHFGGAANFGEPATSFASTPREFWPTGVAIVSSASGNGYWILESGLSGAGTIAHFGDAAFFGDTQTLATQQHAGFNGMPVGMAATPMGNGYWEVHSDGGVFSFGAAKYFGSLGGVRLSAPIIGMAATIDGKGYWLAGADGKVYPFGNAAHFAGVGVRLARPVVGIAANAGGPGVWLTARDGGVFALGGAPYLGSMGGKPLHQPVFGIAARPAVTPI
jgi:hypothetical protein